MNQVTQHFVEFHSPGTLVAETTSLPIDSYDVNKAVEMAKSVTARYNARPFGFRFITRERGDDDLDSHVSETSCFYHLGGKIRTLKELQAKGDPRDETLISNMECNGWERVVENTNSWRWMSLFDDSDVILDVSLSEE